tara:strand:- start:1040 stop:1267 length:228 start_codon:yes stop_codon:yes gene_type:complete
MGKKKKKGFLSRLKKNPQALLKIGTGLIDIHGAVKGDFNEYDKDGNLKLGPDGKKKKMRKTVSTRNVGYEDSYFQ